MFCQQSFIWIFTLYIINFEILIEASNIDIFNPIFIKNTVDGPESLFGTTVLLVKDKTNSPGIIIGAPRANSNFTGHTGIYEPGVVWQCSFERKSEVCRIVTMDETGNVQDPDRTNVMDKKDDGWLGGSTAVDSEIFVSCGSRWINQFDENKYDMNGICYWRPKTDIFESTLPVPSKESRLLPLIQKIQNEDNYWSLGQAGFSIHIPVNQSVRTKEMLIGAPGINKLRGSVIKYSNDNSNDPSGNPFNKVLVIRPEISLKSLQIHSYFGFTVSSGNFFKDDTNDGIQYVSGAPRGNNLAGEVLVFTLPNSGNVELKKLFEIDGKQIGSYFGSSICVADINGDGNDDLLIGAPQYAIEHKVQAKDPGKRSFAGNGYGDEGVVFVYLSNGESSFEQSGILNGRNQAWSHFGTAIANLGDINHDGITDIAVAAPYELDGTGVVYIYHGGINGIVKKPVQIIEAQKLDKTLKGFGFSLSETQDIDNNGYNDLAIGAYDSGQVVILRTSPLIIVNGIVKSEIKKLPLEAKKFDTFKIESCVSYEGKNVPDKLELQVKILMDVGSRLPRVLVKQPEQSTAAAELMYQEELNKGNESCTTLIAVVERSLEESSGKVVIVRQEIQVPEKGKSINPTIYEIKMFGNQTITSISGADYGAFCKNCPMVDKLKSKMQDLQLPLAVLCGEDDKCVSDLRLKIEFAEFAPGRPYVIGSSTILSMSVKVTNLDETAIAPSVLVSWKKRNLRKTPAECQNFMSNDTFSSFKCSLGKFLDKDRTATVLLEFDMTDLVAGSLEEFWYEVKANTASEMKTYPVLETKTIPISAVADIFMDGSYTTDTFNPNTLVLQLNFMQTYEIGLDGPSAIAGAIMEFNLPVSFRTSSNSITNILVYEPRTVISQGLISCFALTGSFAKGHNTRSIFSKDIESSDIDITPSNTLKISDNLPKEEKVEITPRKKASELLIECSSEFVECMQVRCRTDTFYWNTRATITFTMSIESSDLRSLFRRKDSSYLEIISSGSVSIKDDGVNIVPYSFLPDTATSVTVIQEESAKKVSKWIYGAAIITGFLVLAVLVSCLYACGCFERKSKPEPEDETEEDIPLQEGNPENGDNFDEPDITKDEDD